MECSSNLRHRPASLWAGSDASVGMNLTLGKDVETQVNIVRILETDAMQTRVHLWRGKGPMVRKAKKQEG